MIRTHCFNILTAAKTDARKHGLSMMGTTSGGKCPPQTPPPTARVAHVREFQPEPREEERGTSPRKGLNYIVYVFDNNTWSYPDLHITGNTIKTMPKYKQS